MTPHLAPLRHWHAIAADRYFISLLLTVEVQTLVKF